MVRFDDTDMDIIRLLLEDGRRPYSDIAEEVGLSPPAVSDRIDRLHEEGIIRRITVDLDRTKLTGGMPVLVELDVSPADLEATAEAMKAHSTVEHVFTTAASMIFCKVFVEDGDVLGLLRDALDIDTVNEYRVHLLTDAEWTPGLGATAFDIECAECGNTVTEEGESAVLGGERYHFCCPSCKDQFVEHYQSLQEGA